MDALSRVSSRPWWERHQCLSVRPAPTRLRPGQEEAKAWAQPRGQVTVQDRSRTTSCSARPECGREGREGNRYRSWSWGDLTCNVGGGMALSPTWLRLLVSFPYALGPSGVPCQQLPITLSEGNVWPQVSAWTPWGTLNHWGRELVTDTPPSSPHSVGPSWGMLSPALRGSLATWSPRGHRLATAVFTGIRVSPPNHLHLNRWGTQEKTARISHFSGQEGEEVLQTRWGEPPRGQSCRSHGEGNCLQLQRLRRPERKGLWETVAPSSFHLFCYLDCTSFQRGLKATFNHVHTTLMSVGGHLVPYEVTSFRCRGLVFQVTASVSRCARWRPVLTWLVCLAHLPRPNLSGLCWVHAGKFHVLGFYLFKIDL